MYALEIWPEPLVWSQALVNAVDYDRFKALQWGIRTWNVWNFMECDPWFGDDWARHKDFLFSGKRLNVALSRARCLAVLIASPRLL